MKNVSIFPSERVLSHKLEYIGQIFPGAIDPKFFNSVSFH
jgi:hypothetical protein